MARGILGKILGRSEADMPFLEHLEELRRVILASLAAIAICAGLTYVFSGHVLDYMVVHTIGEVQFLRPMEAFNIRIKLALILGTILSLPFVSFQIWGFIVPGLLHHERKMVLPLVVGSTVLFLAGMAFSLFVLTPMMLRLLVGFGTEHVRANIAADYLIDFVLKLAFGSGILFQLPLVVVVLSLLRIVKARWLWSKWRHAVVVILIIGAVVTPGDGPSQVVLAAPVLLLYFLSAIAATMIESGRRKREREALAEKGVE